MVPADLRLLSLKITAATLTNSPSFTDQHDTTWYEISLWLVWTTYLGLPDH